MPPFDGLPSTKPCDDNAPPVLKVTVDEARSSVSSSPPPSEAGRVFDDEPIESAASGRFLGFRTEGDLT